MIEILKDPEVLGAIFGALSALGVLAVVVTKMTASTKDDEYASKFLKVVQTLGGWLGAKPKA